MTNSFKGMFLTPLAVLILGTFALAPIAEAAAKKGGGGGGAAARAGGGGGGGARAGGGGAAKQKPQVNNSKKDVRTNNVRNTSVNNVNNNVNVNKNVNVSVDNNRGGCCNNGWDNDYHPIATAAAVTATVAVTSAIVGSIVNAPPPGCVPVNYGGMIYQQCGSTWYQPQGAQYVVINPPY
jgi:hypothetical protein